MWYAGYGRFVDRIVQYTAQRRSIEEIRKCVDCRNESMGIESCRKSMAGPCVQLLCLPGRYKTGKTERLIGARRSVSYALPL